MTGFNADSVRVGANGHVYGLNKTPFTWTNAESFAQSIGGHLAKVESSTENAWLFDWALSEIRTTTSIAEDGGGAQYVWLGASDSAKEGTWVWVSDQTSVNQTSPKWGSGALGSEPDDFGGQQDYMALGLENWPSGIAANLGYGNAGQWNDVAGTNRLYSFIEATDVSLVAGVGDSAIVGASTAIETVNYSGKIAEYLFSVSGSQAASLFTTEDKIAARDGKDYLSEIDRLHFSDASLALDVGKGQNAGEIYRLYEAAFDRAPKPVGEGYWLKKLDNGETLVEIANEFTATAEFQKVYGGSAPDYKFYVTELFQHVLGRAPKQAGLDYWSAKLVNGESYGAVLAGISESDENVTNVATLIANGIQYQEMG